jgi:hypothetical protein
MSAPNYGSVPQEEPQGTPPTSAKERVTTLVSVAGPVIVAILIIYGGPALFTSIDALLIATALVYAHAAFELLSGVMFVLNPGALHNGWNPSAGMNTYLAESGGIAYFFWGMLLILKISDPTVLYLNAAFCATWFVYLGSHLLNMPWRPKVALSDGSWAMVPVVVKGVCGVASYIAAAQIKPAE